MIGHMQTGKEAGASYKLAAAGQAPAQAFAGHLYRFLRRGLTMWPHQRSLGPLVALYLAYATPWVAQDPGNVWNMHHHVRQPCLHSEASLLSVN